MQLNKKQLSERDICTKYITPALEAAGWNKHTQLLEEVSFTAGKIYVRGKLAARGQGKRADYILYYKPNIPIAIIEAKDNNYSVRADIQQALEYAQILDIPCVFSSNGDGFLFHDRSVAQNPSGFVNLTGLNPDDRTASQDLTGLNPDDPKVTQDLSGFKNLTGLSTAIEHELPLDQFPRPKETHEASNYDYFGEPIYTYSLRQGINDGFLAPYRTVRIGISVDLEGWRPEKGKTDKSGHLVEDRIYNTRDFDRKLVIDERTDVVAQKVTEFLKGLDRTAKTIVFCQDIDHAERMRSALANWNKDLVAQNHKYVMQITGGNDEGYRCLSFPKGIYDPAEPYPVIATTSELMTTGVDAQTCQVIVLDANINSMTKFKQIIGRGTRINEEYGKMYFTILDFRNVTDLFADPAFDGDPILPARTYHEDEDLSTLIADEEEALEDMPIIDEESGVAIEIQPPKTKNFFGEPPTKTGYANKVYVNGVDVTVLVSRELHFDHEGKPITTSLKDYTSKLIKGQYASLDAFLSRWKSADRKEALIQELQEQGVPVENLQEAVGTALSFPKGICHVAYDQPPLTRRERAMNVKKRDYFTKYGEQARRVLEALLDKYADEGITNLESLDVLKVRTLNEFGSPIEILREFGGKERFLAAVRELEGEIYRVA